MCYSFVYNHLIKGRRKPLQDRVEPPILISRLMTFVLATAVVVLGVLVFTLAKMFPLNRPQVFFLTTTNIRDKELTLTEMPTDMDLDVYKKQFIREYVLARNEIVPDLAVMRAKWAHNDTGVVKTRSTDSVFGKFVMTDMVNIIRQDLDEAFDIRCSVEYPSTLSVVPVTNSTDTYDVTFTYICAYGPLGDMEYRKPYKLRVKLESNAKNAVRWAESMENPLGFRISDYSVIDSGGNILDLEQNDPLNWTRQAEEN